MPRDELRQPLRKRSLAERLWAKRPGLFGLASAFIAAGFIAGASWLALTPRPFAGEPIITATIPPLTELATASTTKADDGEAGADAAPEDVIDTSAQQLEIQVLDGEEQDAPPEQTEASIFIAPHRPLKAAPLPEVTEDSKDGPLPRISTKGRKPFDAYSQVTPLAVTSSGRPKITLVLGGMGLNAKLTKKAIDELPGDVTLGFAPYGEDLQKQVNAARAAGHEIVLQVPMEPVGFPGTNPGPRTLLAEASPDENLAALRWHMSRFAGYSAVTNYMGARLLVAEDALKPVLKEVKARGLAYLEDGTVNLTLSPKVVQEVKIPMQRAGMVIDAEPTIPAITDALAKLEEEAKANGHAIATGSGLDVTIETVAEWAKTLQEKGILLVPVSAAYKGRAS
jgi:polysaccharide deacetylase 2 family uncharacterized protein YibQ